MLAFSSRSRLFSKMRFQQNHKDHYMVRDLNPENLHLNGLSFWQNPKNSIFVHYPQNEISSQKSDSVSFLSLRCRTLWEVSEKAYVPFRRKRIYLLSYWPTDILKYWQWWNHRTLFYLKAGVQQVHVLLM